MRIGIDGHMIGDHSGGNESYYTNFLLNMNPTIDIELFLFVNDDVEVSIFNEKYKIVRFKEKNAFKRNFIELPRLCKKYKLDLLHTQYFIPFYRPCPVVCTIHDICFEHFRTIFTIPEYIRQKLLIPYAAKHSKLIYTVSHYSKEDIVNHYKVKPQKVLVTYNAVSSKFKKLNRDELDERELRKKYGIGDSRYILSVGNLQPRKNLTRLIQAYLSYIKKSKDKSKLVIVGKKAWMYDDILKEACKKSDSIIFTGYVSTEDLVRLYNAATCFIYPSFFEGFGLPPLEAMACGTPVAVANSTSLPEVVGDAGRYFNPFSVEDITQCIFEMMSEENNKPYLKKAEIQKLKFKWEKSSRIILNSYIKVVGEQK